MKLSIIAAATALSATIAATSPATADCINTIAERMSDLAERQSTFYNQRGENFDGPASIALNFACNPSRLTSTRALSNCENAMREADQKFGGLDVLDWDLIHMSLKEYKNHGVCEGQFITEGLPQKIEVPAGMYNRELQGYLEKARTFCENPESREEGIQCLGAVAQATYAIKVFFNDTAQTIAPQLTPSQREVAQTAMAKNDEYCDRLRKLSGRFEDALKPALDDISSCVSAVDKAANGAYRDIVGIAHGDISAAHNPLLHALKEASGYALSLNLMRYDRQ